MKDRVRKMRERSVTAKPYVTPERAVLVTEFYAGEGATQSASTPVKRALALKFLLEHKQIFIDDGELIVGERGSAPKAVPTYPEICCHSLQDLEILNSRKKTPFAVDKETRRIYEDKIIPFWKGKSIREMIFGQMSEEWKAAYEAGVFTEFLEQRAPGHTVLDDKIYHRGMLDFKRDIEKTMRSLDFLNDPEALKKMEELKAMEIAADALMRYAQRHAEKAKIMAKKEKDPHAVYLGRMGGKARLQKVAPEKRREIARKASLARWAKQKKRTEES